MTDKQKIEEILDNLHSLHDTFTGETDKDWVAHARSSKDTATTALLALINEGKIDELEWALKQKVGGNNWLLKPSKLLDRKKELEDEKAKN